MPDTYDNRTLTNGSTGGKNTPSALTGDQGDDLTAMRAGETERLHRAVDGLSEWWSRNKNAPMGEQERFKLSEFVVQLAASSSVLREIGPPQGTRGVLTEVGAERARQVAKGYDAAKDDANEDGELEDTAAAVLLGSYRMTLVSLRGRASEWGAHIRGKWFANRRQMLIIVAALAVAAVERLDRQNTEGGA